MKSHNGVKLQLGNLVNKGELKKEHFKTFGLLSDFRHKGDYDDLFDFSEEMVKVLFQPVERFIIDVERIISS